MDEINDWRFPFGQPVQKVVQTDRTPKRVFVLGVYASAVHAHWINTQNKTIVRALAVASEPYIFWRGDNANSLIQQIPIPSELGRLSPADKQFNGPSGNALDELILEPMGLKRKNAWLCDLVPHSCMNPSQKDAIERAYVPEAKKYKLPKSSVPVVPSQLTNEKRRNEILDEFRESKSGILILLGDKPIEWFLRYFDKISKNLSGFGRENKTYGRLHTTLIDGKEIAILPLAHPRQIAKLGHSSTVWYELHQDWIKNHAGKVLHL
jgi:uracil-DNA glycosylase